MEARKRLVVTGTSGRIGRAISILATRSYDVTGVDIVPSDTTDIVADVTDQEQLTKILEGAHAVIHSAGLHAPHVGLFSEEEFRRVNVEGTAALRRAATAAGVNRIVFTSTTAVFGVKQDSSGRADWIDGVAKPRPRTIYHHTKLEAEANLAEWASPQLRVAVLRIGRCFPEPANLMALYRLYRGIDERDAAEAHIKALEVQRACYAEHIISGTTPFFREDQELLGSNAPAAIRQRCPDIAEEFLKRGWMLPAIIDRVYDNADARRELNWHPRFGFAHVLQALESGSETVLPPLI